MSAKLYQIVILLGVIIITNQKKLSLSNDQLSEDEIAREIRQILHEIKGEGNIAKARNQRSKTRHHHHKQPSSADEHDHHSNTEHKNLMNIQTLNLIFKYNHLRKKEARHTDLHNRNSDLTNQNIHQKSGRKEVRSGDEVNDVNELIKYLQQLENDDSGQDRGDDNNFMDKTRCSGDKCGKNFTDDSDENGGERCNRCGGNRYCNDNESLRCGGNRCNKHRISDQEALRCTSGTCGRDSVRRDEENQCSGDRCDRSGNDNSDTLVQELLQHGKKYKINEDLDAIVIETSELEDIVNIKRLQKQNNNRDQLQYSLRCGCGRGQLRCSGVRCGDRDESESNEERTTNDDNNQDLKHRLQKVGKKYKINKKYSAIVVDLSDLHQVFKNPHGDEDYFYKKSKQDKILEDVMDELKDSKAVILDLDDVQTVNGEKSQDFKKPRLFPPNQFRENKHLNSNKNQREFQKLLASKEDLNEIKTGANQKKPSNYEIEKLATEIIFGKQKASETKYDSGSSSLYWQDARDSERVYFPKTKNQQEKKKIVVAQIKNDGATKLKQWRRNRGGDGANIYGVPFELDIQGLGQVNP